MTDEPGVRLTRRQVVEFNAFSVESALKDLFSRIYMSAPTPEHNEAPADPVEAIVPLIPIVLPVVGGVLMFLLAFIAVSMA